MGVSNDAISRVTGVELKYKSFNNKGAEYLSQRLAVIGLGNSSVNYSTDKYEAEGSAAAVGERFGFGSPLHLVAKQLFSEFGDAPSFAVTFYPLANGTDSAAASVGAIGATGTATSAGSGVVYIGGVEADFSVASGDTAASVLEAIKTAVNGVIDMPVTAGTVSSGSLPLTAKFKGEVGDLITIQTSCTASGITLTTTAMDDGAGDPDVSTALSNIGSVWETVILNCFGYSNTTRLGKYQTFGETRWGSQVKKPCLVAHGCTDNYATRAAVTDARKDDYVNFLITSVGSRELPFVVAARGLIKDIMTTANEHPACGYVGKLTGLHCGDDSVQEDYSTRNNAVKKGASTNVKVGSVAQLNDIVTFYHPTSEGNNPSKRYVVTCMKLMNIVYNVNLIMEADDVIGSTLVPDGQVVTDSRAIQPKTIRARLMTLANSLALKAIIVDTDYTKQNMTVAINSSNPNRVDVVFPVLLSGNAEVTSTEICFAHYFGGEA